VDRCAVFVDAGYLFASGGLLCHNTRKRGELALDEVQLLSWLGAAIQVVATSGVRVYPDTGTGYTPRHGPEVDRRS
jgi:hypothetical protein